MPTVAKAAKVKAKARPAKKVTFARSSGTLSGSRVHAKAAVKRSRSDSEPLAESAVYRGGPVKASKRAKWANLARARAAIADPHANSVKAAATRRRTVEEAQHDERKRMRLRSSSFSQPATPLPANISRKKASGTPSSRPTAPTPTAPRKTLAGPHGEDYQGVARLLKCNVKSAMLLDEWIQENRSGAGESGQRLRRAELARHIELTHGQKLTEVVLSSVFQMLCYKFEDPKTDRFELRRGQDATKQHLNAVVPLTEWFEANKRFAVLIQDETTPTTRIKDQRLWTKVGGSPAERQNPTFQEGAGPGISISGFLDLRGKRILRGGDGEFLGAFNVTNQDGPRTRKKLEVNSSFRAHCTTAASRARELYGDGVIPVIQMDAPNMHRSADSSGIEFAPSLLRLKAGEHPLTARLERQGISSKKLSLEQAKNLYFKSPGFNLDRLDRFANIEVIAYEQRFIPLMGVNSRPDLSTIENYWRGIEAEYARQGKASITTLRETWSARLNSGGGTDEDFHFRHFRTQQLRRFSFYNPNLARKKEKDVVSHGKGGRAVNRKWTVLGPPEKEMAELDALFAAQSAAYEESKEPELEDLFFKVVFAYAHYLNAARLHGPGNGGAEPLKLEELPPFDFLALWPRWEAILVAQRERLRVQDEAEEKTLPTKGGPDAKGGVKSRAKAKAKAKGRGAKSSTAAGATNAKGKAMSSDPLGAIVGDGGVQSRRPPSTRAAARAALARRAPSFSIDLLDDDLIIQNAVEPYPLKGALDEMRTPGCSVRDEPLDLYIDLLRSQLDAAARYDSEQSSGEHSIFLAPLRLYQLVTESAMRPPQSTSSKEASGPWTKGDDARLEQRVEAATKTWPQQGLVLVPAFVPGHYFLLLVNLKERLVVEFNSVSAVSSTQREKERFLHFLSKVYAGAGSSRTRKKKGATWRWLRGSAPQQTSGSNACAIYMLSFIRSLIETAGVTVESKSGFHSKMSSDLLKKRQTALRARFAGEIARNELTTYN